MQQHLTPMKIIQALKTKKQQLLRFLFGSFSATAIMFTFQACYGMPPAQNVYIRGTVVDAGTGEPVEGLMVGLPEYGLTDTTDANGTFDYPESQYIIKGQIVDLQVTDIDSTENGLYEQLNVSATVEELASPLRLEVMKVDEEK